MGLMSPEMIRGERIMKKLIATLLLLAGSTGVAHADTDADTVAACDALMHQPKGSYVGPNHAARNLIYDGMPSDRAYALVNQLIVVNTNAPEDWRPAQTCFDLSNQGRLNNGPEDSLRGLGGN